MSYSVVVGNLEPDMFLTVSTGEDLSDAVSVELFWRKPDGTESIVDLTDVDRVTGRMKRVWESGDTDMPGVHRGRMLVTWEGEDDQTTEDDEPETFPKDGTWFIWWVYP